ncbi:MAG: hypothetical protein GX251_02460 [Firmicutes bacterium]|nr:hypothetical protein [Bacillota bacterium]
MCKLYHLFPDGTERLQASGEAVESTERNDVLQTKVEASRKLEWVEEVFSQNRPIQLKVLHKVYSELSYVKGEAPELFAGDRVYLWEQLAFAFNYYGQIKQVEKSLRNQAELQPAKSDAFLNLGVFLTDRGFYQEAIAVYKEGLERTPTCEFLNYNLANLARFTGQHKLAEKALNDAMLANPSRGLNLLAKAEHCLEQEQYEMAVSTWKRLCLCFKRRSGGAGIRTACTAWDWLCSSSIGLSRREVCSWKPWPWMQIVVFAMNCLAAAISSWARYGSPGCI